MNKKISLLIVDDNINFVKRLITLLGEVDNISSIQTAFNYEEAARKLDQKPDIVLLDIKLPGRNGMDLLGEIKRSAGTSEVIMLTNLVGEYYRQQCEELGAACFLDKTNEFEMVPAMIREYALRTDCPPGATTGFSC